MKTKPIAFRANALQEEKLQRLAIGEGTTVSGVLSRMVDLIPVKVQTETVTKIDISVLNDKSAIFQPASTDGAFARS